MNKKQENPANRIWLPPVNLCCLKASFYFEVNINLNSALVIKCPEHGAQYVESPLRKSHHDVLILFSTNLFKLIWKHLSVEERVKANPRIVEHFREMKIKVAHKGKIASLFPPFEEK